MTSCGVIKAENTLSRTLCDVVKVGKHLVNDAK